MKRKIALFVLVIGAGGVIPWLFFFAIPRGLDRERNALGALLEDTVAPVIPSLHQSLRVVDLHADTLLWDRDLLQRSDRGHVDLPRLQEGGVQLQVFSVVTKTPRRITYESNSNQTDNVFWLALAQRWPFSTWNQLSERALHQARRLQQAERQSQGALRILKSREDLSRLLRDQAQGQAVVGALLLIEGGHALDGDLSKLEALVEAGFRILAPTHLADSELGGSQQGELKNGLTEMGKAWLRQMEDRGLIVDLAHASDALIEDVLKFSSRPPLVSHTGVRGTCATPRNLSDEQLRAIAAKGGLIGIGFWDEVLCGTDVESIVKAIRYAVQVAGISAVALGSDWDGFVRTPIDAARIGWLTAALVDEGFSEAEIRAIMGENALRFFLENLP